MRDTRWMQKTTPNWTELHRNTQNPHMHTPQTSTSYLGTQWPMSYARPYLVLLLSDLRKHLILLLCNNSQVATLPTPASTVKFQVCFKVNCHDDYSIYVFLNHLTCVKLCYHFHWMVNEFLCHWQTLCYMSLALFFPFAQFAVLWFFMN